MPFPGFSNNPLKKSQITSDVSRKTKEEVLAYAQHLWEALYLPNLINPGTDKEEVLKEKEKYIDQIMEEFDRMEKLSDTEYVAFIRWQRANLHKTVHDFLTNPGFQREVERVNKEFIEISKLRTNK